jgi:hypothetical protein
MVKLKKKIENLMRNLTVLLPDTLQNFGCVATFSWPIRNLWQLATGLPALALHTVTACDPVTK